MATVRNIRTLLAKGLGTATIAEVLPCMVEDGGALAPACSGLLADLQRERERISRSIDALEQTRTLLDAVIVATPPRSFEQWALDHKADFR